jgi:dihydrodipicolinate synthase/N-acetylneuraminate lyase
MAIASLTRQIQPGRKIEGISAVLLPFAQSGKIDFQSFQQNLKRTADCGLKPAVNMDTGYTNLLSPEERRDVLRATHEVVGKSGFVAGAFVEGLDGDLLNNYKQAIAEIQNHHGTPILFQSSPLKKMSASELVEFHRAIADDCEALLIFELGEMFASFGAIYPLEVISDLMQIPRIVGMKHSSLNREQEWKRLELRDQIRPEFKIYTGNDLAIDMVMYGSDYLLGLSAFSPEAFSLRDKFWQQSDPRFYELNDLLQYLGFFAFRPPVPAYKHTAAQFLHMRGRIASDSPHPKSQRRPQSDLEILRDISQRLDYLLQSIY